LKSRNRLVDLTNRFKRVGLQHCTPDAKLWRNVERGQDIRGRLRFQSRAR
jgi:hypothetical protein